MTKKDLLEAIEDMPMDAEICVRDFDYEEALSEGVSASIKILQDGIPSKR